MLLYNWHLIFKEADGSLSKAYDLILFVLRNELPRNCFSKYYKYHKVSYFRKGKSFLINPEDLLKATRRVEPRHIVNYVALAARRNIANYIVDGTISLDINQLPSETEINNPLLYVRNGKVHFLFEEIKQRKRKNGTSIQ